MNIEKTFSENFENYRNKLETNLNFFRKQFLYFFKQFVKEGHSSPKEETLNLFLGIFTNFDVNLPLIQRTNIFVYLNDRLKESWKILYKRILIQFVCIIIITLALIFATSLGIMLLIYFIVYIFGCIFIKD